MADGINMTVNFTGPLSDPQALVTLWHYKILKKYIQEAARCRDEAEAAAPVGETGDLKGSSDIQMEESGVGEFCIEVGFGGTLPYTSKDYDYPESASTSQYADGDMIADNYALLVELGHLDRAGNPVPPQPFLGPNFDFAVELLMLDLTELLA